MKSMKARLADIERRIERLEVPPAGLVIVENCNDDRPIQDDARIARMLPGETFAEACVRYGVDPKKQPVIHLRVNDMSVPRPD